MIIDCISDLHGFFPKLKGGDLLIVAGDCLLNDSLQSRINFFVRMQRQPYKERIYIAGNHDTEFENRSPIEAPEGIYLCDSGTEFEGLKIWGSPWTKHFPGMNPKAMAFTVGTDEELAEKWALIPDDIDILVTHCPPRKICDLTTREVHVGSASLHQKVIRLINLKLHCFGHIHEAHGECPSFIKLSKKEKLRTPLFINASHVNEHCEPVNKPIRVIL